MNTPIHKVADILRSNPLIWLVLLALPTTMWGQTFVSNVNASALDTSAVITWTTAVPASSQVKYGASQAYGLSSTFDGTMVVQHSVTLPGLTASTTYHFSAVSDDSSGEQVASLDSKFTTASSTGGGTPPPPTSGGIWISAAELAKLPMSGSAWNSVKAMADSDCGTPQISDQQSFNDTCVLAKALVFGRTGIESYRTEVHRQLGLAIGTELTGTLPRQLALGRNLVSYVLSADIIDLPAYDPSFDQQTFRPWLKITRTEVLDGATLISCDETKPQNWGVVCGASRAAVDIYLGDTVDLARTAQVFKGYLGDRFTWAGYNWTTTINNGGATWSPNPSNQLVPVNPLGATVTWNGHAYNVDGALIADISRGGAFQWPPHHTNYPWTGLGGVIVEAEILYRAGYPVYGWSNQAILRAYQYLLWLDNATGGFWYFSQGVNGPNNWQPWIVNRRYGTNLPHSSPVNQGWNMSWTDWTHQ